jgi:hypothetical protein
MNHYKANKILEEAKSTELSSQLAWACASVGLGYNGSELGMQLMSSTYDDYSSNIW